MFHRLGKTALVKSNGVAFHLSRHVSRTKNVVPSLQSFSAVVDAPTSQTETGFIEKPLKALDMTVVRQIKAELMEGKFSTHLHGNLSLSGHFHVGLWS